MHGFDISTIKVFELFFTVVPNGLVRNPDPYPLHAHTKRVQSTGEHFPITIWRLSSHENIGTMDSESIN